MKLPRLITRRRAKWVGVAATLLLAAAMIASYWYWPSYVQAGPNAPVERGIEVGPLHVVVHSFWMGEDAEVMTYREWRFRRRVYPRRLYDMTVNPIYWWPKYWSFSKHPVDWHRVTIPLWMPLVIVALPTGILFYRDRKPKPGCCAKCRYDLTGLDDGTVCPECGWAGV